MTLIHITIEAPEEPTEETLDDLAEAVQDVARRVLAADGIPVPASISEIWTEESR